MKEVAKVLGGGFLVMAACTVAANSPSSVPGSGSETQSGPGPEGQASAAENASGSRLKAKRYVASDGATQFRGWYDSERKEDCAILPTCNGGLRCVPNSLAALGYFSDSACTKKAASITTAAPYITGFEGSCYRTYPATQVQQAYLKVGANCTAAPSGTYLSLGDEVNYKNYVSAEDRVDN
jgi:hypothetical protein